MKGLSGEKITTHKWFQHLADRGPHQLPASISRYLLHRDLNPKLRSVTVEDTPFWSIATILLLAIFALVFTQFAPYIGAIFASLSVWLFWRYYTGQKTPVTKVISGRVTENILAEIPRKNDPAATVILVAGYKGSFNPAHLYPIQFGKKHSIILEINAVIHFTLIPWSWLGSEWGSFVWYQVVSLGVGIFFLYQFIYIWRKYPSFKDPRYVDNVAGILTLLNLAELWNDLSTKNIRLLFLFTGMKPGRPEGIQNILDEDVHTPENTYILNFVLNSDQELTCGFGEGSLAYHPYDQRLVNIAEDTSKESEGGKVQCERFEDVQFVTMPFIHEGYKCITFATKTATDNNEQICPPEDQLSAAVKWGTQYIKKLDRNGATE